MNPVKRGICISQELCVWIYHASRLAKISENKTIVRMLLIAQEDLAPFDDAGLKRILREPWQIVKKHPALVRRTRRRNQDHLTAIAATRLTPADKMALRELAEKQRITVSALQRQLVEGITIREKLRT